MTRIPYPDPAALSERTRAALAAVPPLNVFRLLSTADPAFPAFLRLTGGLWSEAELSPRRRELVILHVARLADSPYEWHQHVAVAKLCDITDAEIAAIETGAVGADESRGTGVEQAASIPTISTIQNRRGRQTFMGLILLEALVALLIFVAILWWTMFSGRNKGELPDDKATQNTRDSERK